MMVSVEPYRNLTIANGQEFVVKFITVSTLVTLQKFAFIESRPTKTTKF